MSSCGWFPLKPSSSDLHNRVACELLLPGSFPDPPHHLPHSLVAFCSTCPTLPRPPTSRVSSPGLSLRDAFLGDGRSAITQRLHFHYVGGTVLREAHRPRTPHLRLTLNWHREKLEENNRSGQGCGSFSRPWYISRYFFVPRGAGRGSGTGQGLR